MQGNFILKKIDFFNQEKLIKNGISIRQMCILKTLFVMINNNIDKQGLELRQTRLIDNEIYYDFNQRDIYKSLPLIYNSQRTFSRDLTPLINKGFIIKYPIDTKFLIRLNIDDLMK